MRSTSAIFRRVTPAEVTVYPTAQAVRRFSDVNEARTDEGDIYGALANDAPSMSPGVSVRKTATLERPTPLRAAVTLEVTRGCDI